MGSIFRPNNEYWMRSRSKIRKGALLGGDGISVCVNGSANEVAVSESPEIEWIAYLGQIMSIGWSRAVKLSKERSREGTVYQCV